jgi:hypothetical protein
MSTNRKLSEEEERAYAYVEFLLAVFDRIDQRKK